MASDVQHLPSSPSKRQFESDIEMPDVMRDRCSSPLAEISNQEAPHNASKRRKLTSVEKEELQALKDLKIKEKENVRIQKEVERKQKEEERRAREAQKEEEKRAREAQKEEEKRTREEQRKKKADEQEEKRRRKEDQKRQEEEERQKKERSQLRLNAFFAIPKPSKPISPVKQEPIPESESKPALSQPEDNPNPQASASPHSSSKPSKTDYEKVFLPYCLPSNTTLAPVNPLLSNPTALARSRSELESYLSSPPVTDLSLKDVLQQHGVQPHSNTHYKIEPSVSFILSQTLDSPSSGRCHQNSSSSPSDLLQRLSMRHIRFEQDVRPPYYGTVTRVQDSKTASRLMRNPFTKLLPATNYDYDSEAEWEAEEGEDVDEEEDEIESEEDDEDLDGFLDDEGAPEAHRPRMPLLATELEPRSTGICWEDQRGTTRSIDTGEVVDMSHLEVGMLTWPFPHSIDPFSTQYWQTPEPEQCRTVSKPGESDNSTASHLAVVNAAASGKTSKRMVPPELLNEFKHEVDGSDMTKIALVEALKKKFPKVPKDAIANTLALVAERVGPKATDKKWALKT